MQAGFEGFNSRYQRRFQYLQIPVIAAAQVVNDKPNFGGQHLDLVAFSPDQLKYIRVSFYGA